MKRQMAKKILRMATVLLSTLLPGEGCRSAGSRWEGPDAIVPATVKPWNGPTGVGRTIRTAHYSIHTTIDDPDFNNRIAQLMEGSLAQYEKLAPGVVLSARPMDCYVFAQRDQWEVFTRQNTGADAPVYLRVNRGGYTLDDWFACYFIGDVGTYSVASHEGWHQFVGRHFRQPIPPFLEEGIGTMFQNIHWDNDRPRWNLGVYPARMERLRNVVGRKSEIPLQVLAKLHAGDVVRMSPDRIEAFYTETWAFARFLCEGEKGKYLSNLKKLLSDAAAGALHPVPGQRPGEWNPEAVKPLLEHYLGADLTTLDGEFQAYMTTLAGRSHVGPD